ncbi:MAG: hypothetical protein LQ347_005761, partial [Umbilicaria vellea]
VPEDAASRKGAFDYVLLCVKALPDVYDLAAVIESVVTPQHTCILVNTTHTLGVEAHLEQRFPTNVVLSLVSGAEINQLGASEFEHLGATEVWVGPANKNTTIPAAIQNDMAEALAMTLSTGQVDCKVSQNIRQQQYERMVGPIAFHPPSVLFEIPSHAELLEKIGVRSMISDVIDELLQIATAQGCSFAEDFKEKTMEKMVVPSETHSIMYQDFTAKRPMEVETYLGSPIKLAQETGVKVPRLETLYALLHHCNIVNQTRPVAPAASLSPSASRAAPPPRTSSAPPRPPMHNGPMNGNGGPPMYWPPNGNGVRGGRVSSAGPPGRRGPPPMNGYPPRASNGYNPRGPPPRQLSRRPSFENNDLEEFSHVVLYDDIPEGGVAQGYQDMPNGSGSGAADLALRERELMLRQKELHLREQEYNMRNRGRRPPPPQSHRGGFEDDDDDDDDFFDPMASRGPPPPTIDPDNFDMMSVTSRRARKAPSASQLRKDPDLGAAMKGGGMRQSHTFGGFRPPVSRNRASARMVAEVPGLHDDLMDNPMMSYSSDRYGSVDRKNIGDESRTNSLTATRLNELQGAGMNAGMNGAYPSPQPRRASQSPGNPFNPGSRHMGRPSPPHDGYMPHNGGQTNGRPSPPGMMRQPVPRYPPGQGNAVAPHQVEQRAGVSNHYPLKGPPPKNVRSLTGSASASAGSGDSAKVDSENSAHSSQSSLGPRAPIGVR